MAGFVKSVIYASEKAANIARACRMETDLFSLLVQEKVGGEANARFRHDFKTLADVLIQEAVSHDICKEFPEMEGHIYGEESNKFTNTLGETINVQVQDTQAQTADLLTKVLDGNISAGAVLAAAVHDGLSDPPPVATRQIDWSTTELAVWIDPIDSTAEYICGDNIELNEETGVYCKGFCCCTVLIGVYIRNTGVPVFGVINQPFSTYCQLKKGWVGSVYWGVSYNGVNFTSDNLSKPSDCNNLALISSSEKPSVLSALSEHYSISKAPGAGYKALCVATGLASLYVLSKPTTYRWDTCAPHGILKALGGGIVVYEQILNSKDPVGSEMTYHQPGAGSSYSDKWNNSGGFIAYRDGQELDRFLKTISK